MFNDSLGFLHSCPSNCGTGLRASVHVRLPLLHATGELRLLCDQLALQPRGVHGEHSEVRVCEGVRMEVGVGGRAPATT
jgi:creatine kinase